MRLGACNGEGLTDASADWRTSDPSNLCHDTDSPVRVPLQSTNCLPHQVDLGEDGKERDGLKYWRAGDLSKTVLQNWSPYSHTAIRKCAHIS